MSFNLITDLQKQRIPGLNASQFWKDSLLGAIAAKSLAKKVQPHAAEDAFILGLLQDIGSLALAYCMPDQ